MTPLSRENQLLAISQHEQVTAAQRDIMAAIRVENLMEYAEDVQLVGPLQALTRVPPELVSLIVLVAFGEELAKRRGVELE